MSYKELEKLKEPLQRFDQHTGRSDAPDVFSTDFFSPSLGVGEKKSVYHARATPKEEKEIRRPKITGSD